MNRKKRLQKWCSGVVLSILVGSMVFGGVTAIAAPFEISPQEVALSTPVTANVTFPVTGPYSFIETDYQIPLVTGMVSGGESGLDADTTSFALVTDGDDTGYVAWNGTGWESRMVWLPTTHSATENGSLVNWQSAVDLPLMSTCPGIPVISIGVNVTAKDGSSNIFECSTVTWDIHPPVMSIPFMTGLPGGQMYTFTWGASDILSKVDFELFDGTNVTSVVLEGNVTSYEWAVPDIDTDPQNWTGYIRVQGWDLAGNFSEIPAERSFYIDGTDPVLSMNGPYLISDRMFIDGQCTDNDEWMGYNYNFEKGQVQVSIRNVSDDRYWDGNLWMASPVTVTAGLPGTDDLSSELFNAYWFVPVSHVTAGDDYEVQVSVRDYAGNITTSEVSVTYPETPAGIKGDVNGDGVVNVLDITAIVRIILDLD